MVITALHLEDTVEAPIAQRDDISGAADRSEAKPIGGVCATERDLNLDSKTGGKIEETPRVSPFSVAATFAFMVTLLEPRQIQGAALEARSVLQDPEMQVVTQGVFEQRVMTFSSQQGLHIGIHRRLGCSGCGCRAMCGCCRVVSIGAAQDIQSGQRNGTD